MITFPLDLIKAVVAGVRLGLESCRETNEGVEITYSPGYVEAQ